MTTTNGTLNKEGRTTTGLPSRKILLWLGIISIIMLFAAFTSAYLVVRADGAWVQFPFPEMFYVSTAIIILSSLTMHLMVRAARRNEPGKMRTAGLVTLALGIGFVLSQGMAYTTLMKEGKFFSSKIKNLKGVYGKDYTIMFKGQPLEKENGRFYMKVDTLKKEKAMPDRLDSLKGFVAGKGGGGRLEINADKIQESYNKSSGFLFVISGLHIVHLLFGIISLFIVLLGAFRGKYHSKNVLGLELSATYWHFLGILWVYLFLFLWFIR